MALAKLPRKRGMRQYDLLATFNAWRDERANGRRLRKVGFDAFSDAPIHKEEKNHQSKLADFHSAMSIMLQ